MDYDCKNCGPKEQEFCKEYKLGPWGNSACPLDEDENEDPYLDETWYQYLYENDSECHDCKTCDKSMYCPVCVKE